MSDSEEKRVIRLVTPSVEEDVQHGAAMVEILEGLLEKAKAGELRSCCIVYSTKPTDFHTLWAGNVNQLERIGYLHAALTGLSGIG